MIMILFRSLMYFFVIILSHCSLLLSWWILQSTHPHMFRRSFRYKDHDRPKNLLEHIQKGTWLPSFFLFQRMIFSKYSSLTFTSCSTTYYVLDVDLFLGDLQILIWFLVINYCYLLNRYMFLQLRQIIVFEEKRLGFQPQNGIPGFILYFPLEPSYGYLRFEGNGKIPLGR